MRKLKILVTLMRNNFSRWENAIEVTTAAGSFLAALGAE